MRVVGEMRFKRNRRQSVATAIALLCIAVGCAKISDFREPYVQEVFIGSLAITPSLKGLAAAGRASSMVTIVGNESGQTVTLYGLPDNSPFELIPSTDPLSPPIRVSGLEADIIDKRTLKITGFSSMSEGAEDLELEVTGTLVRQGPRISTKPGDPIEIRGRAGPVKDVIPSIMLPRILRIKDGAKVEDIPDDEIIPMYQIKFLGQITSIF